jgi:hypothetical protein
MNQMILIADRTGHEWPVGHWAIRYWREFVHLAVAAVDACCGLNDTFDARDNDRIGEQARAKRLHVWTEANGAVDTLHRTPPLAVATADALFHLCEMCIMLLVDVAEWQSRLRFGVGPDNSADEPPAPNTRIPASDFRSNGLIRRVADIVRALPGNEKPPHPGDVRDADAAISYLERVRQWCETNGEAQGCGNSHDSTTVKGTYCTEDAMKLASIAGDEAAVAIIAIGHDSKLSADEKMRKICVLDKRWAGKKSPEWATMLQVTDQCIRGLAAWKTIQQARKTDYLEEMCRAWQEGNDWSFDG